jgi:hypothetical protein
MAMAALLNTASASHSTWARGSRIGLSAHRCSRMRAGAAVGLSFANGFVGGKAGRKVAAGRSSSRIANPPSMAPTANQGQGGPS